MDSRQMKRTLPPFPAVRAFEAAARRQSFKLAAEELCVTQSAISHQVKGLEEFVGTLLFHRTANGVKLTQSGADYFDDLVLILNQLAASTERTIGVDMEGSLSICATPAFASRWMLQRLEKFNYAYPEIELVLTTTDNPIQFPKENVDVLIQYGQEPMKGFRVEPFMTTTRFPICSPEFLKKWPAIENSDDLAKVTLLSDVVGDDWANWFACAGSTLPSTARGPRFAHCELSMKAAEEGQGIALGYGALIDDEIASGKLIKVLDLETPPKVIYSLTCPESRSNHPRIATFRNWVVAEAATDSVNRIH
jgi:LysR family transcriptional regulator, glycine cleavage system transcriptional activator